MQTNNKMQLSAGDHVVRFYDDDDELTSVVVGSLASALGRDEAAVIVATAPHVERFRAGFEVAGEDVRGAEAGGRLRILDAREMLTRFVMDGAVDPIACDVALTSVLCQAASGGGRVCV
jgi:hypothetical protein